jgi:hypothetical protein
MSDYLSLDDAGFDIFFQNLMTHGEETSVPCCKRGLPPACPPTNAVGAAPRTPCWEATASQTHR